MIRKNIYNNKTFKKINSVLQDINQKINTFKKNTTYRIKNKLKKYNVFGYNKNEQYLFNLLKNDTNYNKLVDDDILLEYKRQNIEYTNV